MMVEVRIPRETWEGEAEAVLANWYYDDGEFVEKGNVIALVMVEKVQYEIVAPESGALTRVMESESVVLPGVLIGTLDPGSS